MGYLTFKPFDSSFWDDKKVLRHPSDTPSGFRFLFTQRVNTGRIITDSKESVPSSSEAKPKYFITPKTWNDTFLDIDVYEPIKPSQDGLNEK